MALNKAMLNGLCERIKTCGISSPNVWLPSPRKVYNLNFDGETKGNPRMAGFGGTCRNSDGEILHIFLGSIGEDTNNLTELEGMLQGINIVIRKGWLLTMVEGDSLILIRMAK